MRWWPRSIRWQMLLGLVLLEALSIALFALLLFRLQEQDLRHRVLHRVAHQTTTLALQAEEAFSGNHPDWMALAVHLTGEAPSVSRTRVTDASGTVLYSSKGVPSDNPLKPVERAEIEQVKGRVPRVFSFGHDRWEGVQPIYTGSTLRGYAWVESDPGWDRQPMTDIFRGIILFGAVWVIASIIVVTLVGRTISRPLATLYRGTKALMASPESNEVFPLPIMVENEFGDLISAFNTMVASIQEQRAGLSDTLSILDSMLANAPVGLAFFDSRLRFVRVNQVFADLTEIPLSRHLGRTPGELLAADVAAPLEEALDSVFGSEAAVREIELSGAKTKDSLPWNWLVSVYAIRTTGDQVRWAGMIVRDVSERSRAEETLRRTEKLAATGRLAASIAHEINNPLEAITNLLFLLRNFSGVGEPALQYIAMAEHETRRITEIAQQTLRFYRQSTSPSRANLAEVINSVLDLYRGRLNTLGIHIERQFDTETTLFCFEGEIRQVIANLVGNAVDAITEGGRLVVRARAAHDCRNPDAGGVLLTVADTGSGMTPEVRSRIFEAFYTTKDATGTGLGLWVSQEIITKHRGYVRVRSRAAESGKPSGTVFQIFLPENEAHFSNGLSRVAPQLQAKP